MSDKKDDGGPAFPRIVVDENNVIQSWTIQHGMSLRDWFAGQALAGLIAGMGDEPDITVEDVDMVFAKGAYMAADAMLKERAK